MLKLKVCWLILFSIMTVPTTYATVKLITPNKIKLGQIRSGEIVKTQIEFINNGQKSFIIERVKTSCGCTAAEMEQKTIDPGDTAHIDITFKSKGFRGQIRKSVTVQFLDNIPASLDYMLDVEVVEELEISPHYIHYKLNAASFDSLVHGQFTLKNTSDRLIKITKISTKDQSITWTQSYTEIEPNHQYIFEFDICPTKKTGFSYEQVVFETDYENKPNIVVPIYVNIKE